MSVNGLVEKNMIAVEKNDKKTKKCLLSKRHVSKTTSRVIYYIMYMRVYIISKILIDI